MLKGVEAAREADRCADAKEDHRLKIDDLIQQTRAADASAQSVALSYNQSLTLLAGVIISFLTLAAAFGAAYYARGAYVISRQSSDLEDRPFLYLCKMTFEEWEIAENKTLFSFCFHIRNSGKLPAYKIAVEKGAAVDFLMSSPEIEYDPTNEIVVDNCPSGVERLIFHPFVLEGVERERFLNAYAAIYLGVRFTFSSRTVKNKVVEEKRYFRSDSRDNGHFYFIQPPSGPNLFDDEWFGDDDDDDEPEQIEG